MHLTLKKEATRPPGANSRQQQDRFDVFVHEFNTERPHEALAIKCPAELYVASPRPYDGLPELTYPFHDRDILVTACGRLCLHRKKINISTVLAGQKLGIKEVDEGIWLASFMHYDLGYFDLEQKTLQPLDNPFGEVVTHVLSAFCHPCVRAGHKSSWRREQSSANPSRHLVSLLTGKNTGNLLEIDPSWRVTCANRPLPVQIPCDANREFRKP
ncbi:MAG: hypothetical protein QOH67_398 [Hyphomicrobiales bacterium]|nr:hypothetical protein [Hyphomicrobiales bacterium]